jgi:phage terminase large subunit GpA-like protein
MPPSLAELCATAFADGMAPEPTLSVSAWADSYRFLSSVASAEPGPWRTSRTPHLREIMDCLSPSHPAERVVVMSGAQIGKTECGNNWIGYVIDRAPGPMLMVQPTVETAKRVSKQRLAPMIEATPVLRDRVAESRSRDSGNTVQVKEFDGGVLIITGANSSAGLRSMPIRFLFMDEVDEYPGDVDGQGDPVALAEKRTATFARRKILLTSTPTIKGLSRIEREYLESDQRRYFVPCPECGHLDYLTWREVGHHRIEWEEGRPETAHMVCSACGARVEEGHKTDMLLKGEWRPTAVSESHTAGFHLSALYSPLGWKSWAQCAAEFLRAKEDPFRLKTWVNTVLGETWEERGDSVAAGSLAARLERYPAEVPTGVGVLVAAVDVQGDRLEAVVKGYGADEESWLIAFTQLHGDPAREQVWHELDRFLGQSFEHESGQKLRIHRTVIDSGGAHTEQVYRYCKARLAAGRSVYPVKGGTLTGRPLLERPSVHNRYRVPLFVLCVDTGKEAVFSRLLISSPGPGYLHLPDWVDAEYLAQLTAEKAIRKYVKGRGAVREWVKLRERNEALDLEVYSLAALYILGPAFVRSLPERAARFAQPAAASETADAETKPPVAMDPLLQLPRRSAWVRAALPPGHRW